MRPRAPHERIIVIADEDGFPGLAYPDTPKWRKHVRSGPSLRAGKRLLVYHLRAGAECRTALVEIARHEPELPLLPSSLAPRPQETRAVPPEPETP